MRYAGLLQAWATVRSIAAELHGKARQTPPPAATRRSSPSPSPDPLYIRAVMAVLQCCFSAGASDRQGGRMRRHVCWVLGAVRTLLQQRALEQASQILQACILAACDWHATKVGPSAHASMCQFSIVQYRAIHAAGKKLNTIWSYVGAWL